MLLYSYYDRKFSLVVPCMDLGFRNGPNIAINQLPIMIHVGFVGDYY